MKLEYGLAAIRREPTSIVTVGSFDGVHAGHQAILSYVIDRARAQRASSTLLTFEPHPREVLTGKVMPLLTSVEEKADILESMGLDRLIVVEFSREFASMLPEEYVSGVLAARIGLQEIVVGHDHGFGRGRRGNVRLLRSMGDELGFSVDVLPAEVVGSRVVSSRVIRQLIARDGDMVAARAMLTRPFEIRGRVIRGAGRGRTIGVPTANLLRQNERKVVPRRGVYVVQAALKGAIHHGMMNIGFRPTVDESTELQLEVHLFDFCKDIYGEVLAIEFLHRLRDEVKFPSIEALTTQLAQDAAESRALLGACLYT